MKAHTHKRISKGRAFDPVVDVVAIILRHTELTQSTATCTCSIQQPDAVRISSFIPLQKH